MKILYINHALHCGGTDNVMLTLATEMANRGHEVYFLTFRPTEEDFFDVPSNISRIDLNFTLSDDVKGVGYVKYNVFKYFFRLRNILKNLSPDYIVSAWSSTNIFVMLATMFTGFKVVITEHIHFDAPPKFWKVLRAIVYRYCYKLAVLTQRDKKKFLSIVDENKIEVISNPLTIKNAGCSIPKIFNDEKINFISVGRFTEQKGFDLLIRAFVLVVDELPNARLTLVGDGELFADMQSLAIKLGIENSIYFAGRSSNVAEYYSTHDVYIMSSRFEGFGLVLTEAMSFGLPVISFDCPTGPREIIGKSEYGVLVSEGCYQSLANAMISLGSNRDLFYFYSKKSLRRYKDYSVGGISDIWERKIFCTTND